ncbi:MAG: hypothetical protein ABSE77_12950 [Acidimicrobiales bacterium]|jgi:hypothetical protein
MTQPPSPKSPAERVLDLAVYGPLGMALSIAEAMPAMARKGRSRLAPQVGLARTVGQLAVQQGYRQLRGMAASGPAIPFLSRRPATGDVARGPHVAAPPAPGPRPHGANPLAPAPRARAASRPRPARTAAASPARKAPGAAELAIPSYDSLSATHVVQRLAGLSHDEVAAVRAYEAATRGRRTILSRAEQLLG